MAQNENEILIGLADAVVKMDEDRAVELSKQALLSSLDPYLALTGGLVKGMESMSEKFENGSVFVPELLLASDALYAGLEILKPHVRTEKAPAAFKVVIGVVEGDTHDIGKNIVRILLEAGGFAVIDLGRDVELRRFVEVAEKEQADIIGLSSLMTTTMGGMKEVVDRLEKQGLRKRFKVLVGGAPVSSNFATKIGADAYAANAAAAVRSARQLVGRIGSARGTPVETSEFF